MMSEVTVGPTAQQSRYRAAFARCAGAIRAVPETEYAAVLLPVMPAVRTTEAAVTRIREQRRLIVDSLPEFDIRSLDRLEDYALALGHAQRVYEASVRSLPPLHPLADTASVMHGLLLSEVSQLIERGLIASRFLSRLKGTNGYENLAADLFVLCGILRKSRILFSDQTSIKPAELDQAEHLARRLDRAIGFRKLSVARHARAARDRQAVYTLFVKAYAEVRAAIGCLLRAQDVVDFVIPPLLADPSDGKAKHAAVRHTPVPAPVAPVSIPPSSGPGTVMRRLNRARQATARRGSQR